MVYIVGVANIVDQTKNALFEQGVNQDLVFTKSVSG